MITSFTAIAIDPNTYELNFASDLPSPTFRLYSDGQFLYSTTLTSAIVYAPPGAARVFDVLDDDSDDDAITAYPSTVTLAWYAVSGAVSYRVDQLIDAVWTETATLTDDGRGYFVWQSATQPDGQVASFRVVPTGDNGNDGTPTTFAVLIVRIPDPPAVTMTYNASTGVVTITG